MPDSETGSVSAADTVGLTQRTPTTVWIWDTGREGHVPEKDELPKVTQEDADN